MLDRNLRSFIEHHHLNSPRNMYANMPQVPLMRGVKSNLDSNTLSTSKARMFTKQMAAMQPGDNQKLTELRNKMSEHLDLINEHSLPYKASSMTPIFTKSGSVKAQAAAFKSAKLVTLEEKHKAS